MILMSLLTQGAMFASTNVFAGGVGDFLKKGVEIFKEGTEIIKQIPGNTSDKSGNDNNQQIGSGGAVNNIPAYVLQAQSRLNYLGYDAGPENGKYTQKTRNAILAYEADNGMPLTGNVTVSLNKHLFSSKSKQSTRNKQNQIKQQNYPSNPYNSNKQLVLEVQSKLKQLGYSVGTIDGLYGPSTRNAISLYQKNQGLAVDGNVSPGLIVSLNNTNIPNTTAIYSTQEVPSSNEVLYKSQNTYVDHNETAFVSNSSSEITGGNILSPEGVSLGMNGPQARSILESKGFVLNNYGSCSFSRADGVGSVNKPNTEINLNVENYKIDKKKIYGNPESVSSYMALQRACGNEEFTVKSINYKQYVDRSNPINATGILAELNSQFGEPTNCRQVFEKFFTNCEWNNLPDNRIELMQVSAGDTKINVLLNGDELEVRPNTSENADTDVSPYISQALSICENYGTGGSGDTFRSFHDCQCIANKVGKAYAKGAISKVDVQAIDNYAEGCPGDRESIYTYFHDKCLSEHAWKPSQASYSWAKNGGCDCYANSATEAYLKNLKSTWASIGKVSAIGLVECQYMEAVNSVQEATFQESQPHNNSDQTTGFASMAQIEQNSTSTYLDNVRPFKLRLFQNKPVIFLDHLIMKDIYNESPETEEFRRYTNLLLLDQFPDLTTDEKTLLDFAGQNLTKEYRKNMLLQCDDIVQVTKGCAWSGRSEFEKNRNKNLFKTEILENVRKLSQGVPKEFIVVERFNLEDYDESQSGFILKPVGTRIYPDRFELPRMQRERNRSRVEAIRQNSIPLPHLWKMSKNEARELINKIPVAAQSGSKIYRDVFLAWQYKVVDFNNTTTKSREDLFQIYLEPMKAGLYKEKTLDTLLLEYTPDQTGLVNSEPSPTNSQSVAVQENINSDEIVDPTFLPVKIYKHDDQILFEADGPYINEKADQIRLVNLILLKNNPVLASNDDNVFVMAKQNFVDLTEPGKDMWLGDDQFEIDDTKQRYLVRGTKILQENTISLPIEMIVKLSVNLGEYNFESNSFPLLKGKVWMDYDNRGQDLSKLGIINNWSERFTVLNKKYVYANLLNKKLPSAWQINPQNAEKIAELFVSKEYKRSLGTRTVYLGVHVKLNQISNDSPWLIDSMLEKIDVYYDPDLNNLIGSIPI